MPTPIGQQGYHPDYSIEVAIDFEFPPNICSRCGAAPPTDTYTIKETSTVEKGTLRYGETVHYEYQVDVPVCETCKTFLKKTDWTIYISAYIVLGVCIIGGAAIVPPWWIGGALGLFGGIVLTMIFLWIAFKISPAKFARIDLKKDSTTLKFDNAKYQEMFNAIDQEAYRTKKTMRF